MPSNPIYTQEANPLYTSSLVYTSATFSKPATSSKHVSTPNKKEANVTGLSATTMMVRCGGGKPPLSTFNSTALEVI